MRDAQLGRLPQRDRFNALLLAFGMTTSARPVEQTGAVNLTYAATIGAVLLAARRRMAAA
jgi:hypothetical protein